MSWVRVIDLRKKKLLGIDQFYYISKTKIKDAFLSKLLFFKKKTCLLY